MNEIKIKKNTYIIDGVEYDRVTSVLGYFMNPKLVEWQMKVGKEVAKRKSSSSKRIGTRVHNLVQTHFEKGKYRLASKEQIDVANCMQGYDRWMIEELPQIIEVEKIMKCDKLRIAGTTDIILTDTIIDIKTSAAIRPDYWIQLAVYRYLYGKDLPIAVLRLDKLTGDYQYKRIKDCSDRLFNAFLGLLNYYRYHKLSDGKEVEKEDGTTDINITLTEIESKLGVFRPEIRNDWSEWHREI